MMKSSERFITAIQNKMPDMVPVAPDMSNYIPCKRTGLPFWEIYFENAIPLYKAYIDAATYFGIDSWAASTCGVPMISENEHISVKSNLVRRNHESVVKETTISTPDGELYSKDLCYIADPPSPIEKVIKDFSEDFPKYKWLLKNDIKLDVAGNEEMRGYFHARDIAYGGSVSYPGFHMWNCFVQGGIMDLMIAEMECPEILEEWWELDMAHYDQIIKANIEAKPDYILYGGSGTVTLASPDLAKKYAIPALKRWSKWTRDAGIPSMIHSCGLSRWLVEELARETDIDCINPLEMPPMGDVDICEVKEKLGKDIALMGNIHTTDVMLNGTVDEVKETAKFLIKNVGKGGGFILSTGDQCARDTPEENIFALVETAREYGVYNSDGSLGDF